MEYNANISLEKVEEKYLGYLEMNEFERKLFLQYVVGRNFAIVQSIRIIPVKPISKDLRSIVLKEDID
jgi:hypothetical protein